MAAAEPSSSSSAAATAKSNSMISNGSGLVKQLFLPGFTDAGGCNIFVEDSHGPDSVISDASTCVHNNLTSNKATANKKSEPTNGTGLRRESSSLSSALIGGSPSSSSPVTPEPETRDTTPSQYDHHQDEGGPDQEEVEDTNNDSASLPTKNNEKVSDLTTAVETSQDVPSSPSTPPNPSDNIVITKLTSSSIQTFEKQERGVENEYCQQGKRNNNLLLERSGSQDVSSDVLSTASEMGTVIEMSQDGDPRLAQVDALLMMQQEQGFPITTPKRRNYYESMFEEDEDKLVDDIALPMLDGRFYHDEKKTETPRSTAIGSVAASAGGGILSRTMKRFTTNMSSAPNTPRGGIARLPPPPTNTTTAAATTTTFSSESSSFSPPRRRAVQPTTPVATAATPSSFLLRSPGSTARIAANRGGVLSPRFSSFQHKDNIHEQLGQHTSIGNVSRGDGGIGSGDMSVPKDRHLQLKPQKHQDQKQQEQQQQQPLRYHQLARACFSFDAYDTCVDHLYEVPVQRHQLLLPSVSSSSASSPLSPRQRRQHRQSSRLVIPTRRGINGKLDQDEMEGDQSDLKYYNSRHTQPLFRVSSSWDVGVGADDSATGPPAAPSLTAFRPSHSRRNHIAAPVAPQAHYSGHQSSKSSGGPLSQEQSSAFEATTTTNLHTLTSPPRPNNKARLMMVMTQSPPRLSMTKTSRAEQDVVEELKSPQRIEIEREDALDILACLVERGVTMKDDSLTNLEQQQTPEPAPSNHPNGQAAATAATTATSLTTSPEKLDIAAVVQDLKELSRNAGDNNDSDGTSVSHDTRVQTLDELVRSHEYAMEMRRVSQSASSWLKSIGRSSIGSSIMKQELLCDLSNISEQAATDETFAECIDLLTAKAMLHSARIEIDEKSEYADRLNAELAKCRAEIGRLKSSGSGGTGLGSSFRSPNRSILDASDDLSVCETDGGDNEINRSFDNASPIPDKDDSHCLDTSFEDIIPLRQDKSDLAKFQAALEEANEMIRKLHAQLKQQSREESSTGMVHDEAPVVQISEGTANRKSSSPSNKDESTVNVRMLDAENYVTDWDELRPPLPPPPDHGLRSPIVTAVLQQWSSDPSLQECLLSWMEQVLTGTDPSCIPPLTLSSLNHQVRDGFIMHVLPLLLRRPDIRVDVQTRAQRLTTYDLAVSIDSIATTASPPNTPPHRTSLDVRRHLETMSARSDVGAGSATHSSATALISNSHYHHHLSSTTRASNLFIPDEHYNSHHGVATSSRLSYDEIAEGMGPHQHTGIMSALGGAIGGLLSRRNKGGHGEFTSNHEHAYNSTTETPGGVTAPTPTGSSSSLVDSNHPNYEDEAMQPYHRVLAAPPGRLAITFVEYRGHAMVSDVAPESPLVGWIFPSDILIAIDELPVSGMRVRDIIQVLKDRQGRQRALRVISSHDMTELTIMNNTSAMNDVS